MFRPFLPCGSAYALPMAFHALFPAEGIPPGCLYCTISARCLSTGFGRISAAFAFFRRRGGGAPVSGGDCSGVAGAAGVGGALRGACFLCCLPTLPLVFVFAPYPPSPRSQSALPRRGRGRLKVYFAGGFAPGTPALNRLRHLQTLPEQVHGAGTCLLCCLPTLPLVFDFAPYPPSPLPRRGRGRLKVYFAGGFAPGTPALNRLRHLQTLPYRHPAKGSLRLGAKTVEMLSFGQCRQPRRGGTGGDGTIRRKRRRRLRWSSPPGQG